MRLFVQVVSVLALVMTAGFGCQKKPGAISGLIGEGLMSDRPDVVTGLQIYLVELKADSLAASAQKNAQGILEINEEQKVAIEQEQAAAEKKFKELSSEIRVLYRYKYVLNGVSVVAPAEMVEKIQKLAFVRQVQPHRIFQRPQPKTVLQLNPMAAPKVNLVRTSVTHIEAQAAYDKGVKGQGIRVGVLDTGIDYTHKMMGGTGLVEDYAAVDVKGPSVHFPNQKVVGGIDLVGSRFDTSSLDSTRLIPIPDMNPMDEGGHGTHVAGSISGIGDGIQSYDGVAPEALLYAIKVFGSGSTSDEVVIAGLEYAVDPNQDGKFDDQLHVVNLSLGGSNGTPYELYNKAVSNLTRMGTVMVASAGNSSDIPFIVGSPGTSDDALSVAAQIDHSDHNWKFKTIGFFIGQEKLAVTEAIESVLSKPIAELEVASGELVYGGLAEKDYSAEEAALIKGKVVLIDRGLVTFQEKMARGEKAGAIGVIVAQNRDEAPFTMGGEGKVQIPAVMISQQVGQKLKQELEKSLVVTANFKNPDLIEKPENVGIITDFSSRGPRSYDLLIKPEITAPGQNIISASMGEGDKTVQLSGTSMSGPHMAGVMALMKQAYATLSTRELKSVVMSTAIPIKTAKGEVDSIARQGAGQVLVSRAIKAQFTTEPSAVSLGLQQIEREKRMSTSLRLKSLGDDDLQLQISLESSSSAVSMVAQSISLKPRGLTDVKLNWVLKASVLAGLEDEVSGWIVLKSGEWSQKVPFLVRLQKISNIKLTQSKSGSTSQRDAEGSEVSLEFTNRGTHAGDVWPFNLMALDEQKSEGSNQLQSSECDIKAVGYRITEESLEVGVKFYRRMTSWDLCEVSLMMDQDGDKKPEAELALTLASRVPGLTGETIVSTLIDFKKAQQIRRDAVAEAKATDKKIELNISKAVLAQDEALAGNLRSAVVLKIPLADLKSFVGLRPLVQVIASANEYKNVETDDFLKNSKRWFALSLNPQDQSWKGLKNMTLQGGQTQAVDLTRGASQSPMLVLYPNNSLDSRGLNDGQIHVFKAQYSEKP